MDDESSSSAKFENPESLARTCVPHEIRGQSFHPRLWRFEESYGGNKGDLRGIPMADRVLDLAGCLPGGDLDRVPDRGEGR
jgi:hypothetical protein